MKKYKNGKLWPWKVIIFEEVRNSNNELITARRRLYQQHPVCTGGQHCLHSFPNASEAFYFFRAYIDSQFPNHGWCNTALKKQTRRNAVLFCSDVTTGKEIKADELGYCTHIGVKHLDGLYRSSLWFVVFPAGYKPEIDAQFIEKHKLKVGNNDELTEYFSPPLALLLEEKVQVTLQAEKIIFDAYKTKLGFKPTDDDGDGDVEV